MTEWLDYIANAAHMPHRHCYLQDQWLVYLQTVIELGFAVCYTAIPFLLMQRVYRATNISTEMHRGVILYSTFIFICGITHAVSAINLYSPHYYAKAFIGVVGLVVNVMALRLTPRVLKAGAKLLAYARVYAQEVQGHVEQRAYFEYLRSAMGQLVRESPNAIAKVGVNGMFQEVNQQFAEIVGSTPETLRGTHFAAITTDSTLRKDIVLFEECLAGERDTYTVEKEYQHAVTKEPIPIILTVLTVRGETGEPLYFMSQIRLRENDKQ